MEILLAVFSGIAVFNSIVFGLHLIQKKERLLKNRLLGLLLIAAGFRIGKSIIILLYPNVSDAIPAIGLIGMASIGPLVFLYTRSLTETGFSWITKYWLHFLFAFIIGVTLLFVASRIIFWLYFFASVQLGGYLLASFRYLKVSEDNGLQFKWLRLLLISLSMVWVVFSAQLFRDTIPVYLAGTVLSAALLYVMILSANQNDKLFAKIKSIEIDPLKLEGIKGRLTQLMIKDRAYLETDLTIAKIAHKLKEKPYVVSLVINEAFKKSGPEFINGYRIKQAERILLSKDHDHLSIEGVAFECGFNTPSAFYTYFKKVHGVTPTEFKSKFIMGDNGEPTTRFA